MTLYIIRHGQTEYNRLSIVQGSGVDSDLNETGLAQAKAFYEAHRHIDFDLVVTSMLRRTHQTVRHFLDHNIPWERSPDINEISWGVQEGKPHSQEQTAHYHRMITAWRNGDLDAAIEGGESARQLLGRIDRFVEWIKQRQERRILVATHGRTIRGLITTLKGLHPTAMEDMHHANTGLYLAHFRKGKWVFELENDTSHLEAISLAE